VKIFLLRHAKAEKRLGWDTPDPLRPLAPVGLRQAHALAGSLARERVRRIISSPHLRCRQSVEPLAARLGLPVELDDRLAEGASTARALELLLGLGTTPTVLCSHGDLVPSLMRELQSLGVDLDGPLRAEKAAWWLIEGRRGAPARARYQPPPEVAAESCEAGEAAPDSELFAVLDLGSTSFHLLVAEATRPGRITPVLSERVMLRLGAMIATGNRIPEEVCERAVETARALGRTARRAGVRRLLPVGTAALREAENGPELAERLGEALGVPVRLVGGEEEARLIFAAFRRRVLLPRGCVLGADLGGGSLELAIGDEHDVLWEATLRLGVARLHGEIGASDPLRRRDLTHVRERVRDALAPHRAEIAERNPHTCVATGGTARALAWLALEGRRLGPTETMNQVVIPVDELRELTATLVSARPEERLRMPGMRKRRADLLPIGSLVFTAMAEELGLDGFTLSDWGLREGVILDTIARGPEPALRGGSQGARRGGAERRAAG
jgi:exopolyphosphatase/guanosine-5'-triphosphate,3'-diphosphate pyrophosphatase